MADETYIYAGAEAHGLYRKKASDTHWEQLVCRAKRQMGM